MAYYTDLSKMSLQNLKNRIEQTRLLPSQQILLINLEDRISCIDSQGISDVEALKQVLKAKDKLIKFAKQSKIDVDFLNVLRREINSYHPKTRKLSDYPAIKDSTKELLIQSGLKTSKDLYKRISTIEEREVFASELNLKAEEVLELTKLVDVSRLRYVNGPFASLLLQSSYDTMKKIKEADPEALYLELTKLNQGKKIYKAVIGRPDMKYFVEDQANVSFDIEYE